MPAPAPILLALLALAPLLPAQASDSPLEGHSGHGAVFNEGPRQRAYLMGGAGNVDFPVTTESDLAQKFFNQGMGQLHGYWYFEAERSFRQAAALDPDCVTAYLGMALANIDNKPRAVGFAWEAFKRRDKVGKRERMYIEAYARYFDATKEPPKQTYQQQRRNAGRRTRPSRDKQDALYLDLEEIILEFPDDVEAKALLVNQMYIDRRGRASKELKEENEKLLADVFAEDPLHPAHHYRIHLWDSRDTASRTLDSAWKCGLSAPSIAHQWHMGGHTYDKLGRHADAAWVQEASARVDHARMMRDPVMPYQIHNYAHNNEWLCRSLRNVGRIRASIDLAKNMIELPRHPKRSGRGASLGERRLLETLAMCELWGEILALGGTPYLEEKDGRADGSRLFELGRARAMTGDVARGRELLAKLRELSAQSAAARPEQGGREAQSRDDGDSERPRPARRRGRGPRGNATQLAALLDWVEKRDEGALQRLQRARYSAEHLAMLWLEAGDRGRALESARRIRTAPGVALPRAKRAWVFWGCGERDEALQEFRALRELSARFDLDVPPFRRLAPIAAAEGLDADWRVAYEKPKDVGERPPLESLGPFRWAPAKALAFELPRPDGEDLSLASYRGKPVLLVFFLGFGCVHCVEQLDAIQPRAGDFKEAGIEIVTIGTDTLDQIKSSITEGIENGEDPLPFPILADPAGDVFKRYRCWDDFEDMALHGTFLIDGKGRVRWQDISFEPFMETEFLLNECKRLLALPEPAAK